MISHDSEEREKSNAVVSGRFSAIHDAITEWQKHDASLRDKIGFLEYLKTCDISQFAVVDQKRWMEYYRKAERRSVTVADVLFDSRKARIDMKLVYERDPGRNDLDKVFVVDEEKRKELEEMDERLKSYDPARVKRKSHS